MMEVIEIDVLFYIVLGLIVLYFVLGWDSGNYKHIPGPTGWPIVGYAPFIRKGEEHISLSQLADKYGDICKLNVFGQNIIVLNSAQLIRKAFSGDEYKKFINDRDVSFVGKYVVFDHQSIASNLKAFESTHGKLRKAFAQGLNVYGEGKKVFEDNVTSELVNLVEKIQLFQCRDFDMITLLRRSLTNVLSILLGGHDLKDDDKDVNMFWEFDESIEYFLGPGVDSVMTLFPFLRFIPGVYKTTFENTQSAKETILRRFFYEKKATYKPGEVRSFVDFFIGEQLEAQKEGRDVFFTDERIMAILLETIVAGILTSLSTLSSLILCLINFPEYQTKIQAELDRVVGRERFPVFSDRRECVFTEAAILESLRYLPAAPLLFPHFCEAGLMFEGYQIPPKSTVIANVWYVHHDEKIWTDPWTFRPERWLDDNGDLLPNDHILRQNWLPFGKGRRQCPGEGLARSRIFLYVATLLQKWTFQTLPENAVSFDPRYDRFDVVPKSLLCKAVPRAIK